MRISFIHFFSICSLNQNDELPLYNSIVEDDECVLCRSDIDEPSEFGKKKSVEDITVHHFCLVSSDFLVKNQEMYLYK